MALVIPAIPPAFAAAKVLLLGIGTIWTAAIGYHAATTDEERKQHLDNAIGALRKVELHGSEALKLSIALMRLPGIALHSLIGKTITQPKPSREEVNDVFWQTVRENYNGGDKPPPNGQAIALLVTLVGEGLIRHSPTEEIGGSSEPPSRQRLNTQTPKSSDDSRSSGAPTLKGNKPSNAKSVITAISTQSKTIPPLAESDVYKRGNVKPEELTTIVPPTQKTVDSERPTIVSPFAPYSGTPGLSVARIKYRIFPLALPEHLRREEWKKWLTQEKLPDSHQPVPVASDEGDTPDNASEPLSNDSSADIKSREEEAARVKQPTLDFNVKPPPPPVVTSKGHVVYTGRGREITELLQDIDSLWANRAKELSPQSELYILVTVWHAAELLSALDKSVIGQSLVKARELLKRVTNPQYANAVRTARNLLDGTIKSEPPTEEHPLKTTFTDLIDLAIFRARTLNQTEQEYRDASTRFNATLEDLRQLGEKSAPDDFLNDGSMRLIMTSRFITLHMSFPADRISELEHIILKSPYFSWEVALEHRNFIKAITENQLPLANRVSPLSFRSER